MGRVMTAQTRFVHGLVAEMRWVCSGTPFPGTTLVRQLDHLHSILTFLRVAPYDTCPRLWVRAVRRPMLQRAIEGLDALYALLRRVMLRTRARDVERDVRVPPLQARNVLLTFRDALEASNYNKVVTLVRTNLIASRGVGPDSLLSVSNTKSLLQVRACASL